MDSLGLVISGVLEERCLCERRVFVEEGCLCSVIVTSHSFFFTNNASHSLQYKSILPDNNGSLL